MSLGHAAYQGGDGGRAALLIEDALAALRRGGDRAGVAWAHVQLGAALLVQGDPAARRRLAVGLRRARACGEPVATAYALRFLAQAACDRGEPAAAAPLLREGLSLSGGLGDQEHVAFLLEVCAEAAAAAGDAERALRLAAGARALRHRIGAPRGPVDRARLRRWWASARASLRDRGRHALAAGLAMSLQQAIACAVRTEAS